MQAVILVGGLGTRLGTLVADRNKPMAQVAGRPFLEYLLIQLRNYQVREVVLCVGYRGECIHQHFGSGAAWGLRLHYSWEQELRGTGGALKLAQNLIRGEDFLVLNGDSFFAMNLERLIAYHRDRKALATIALADVSDARRYGRVDLDADGAIRRFREKDDQPAPTPGRINSGIYMFRRDLLDLIPAGRTVSLEHEVFPGLIGKGFYGLPLPGYFVDIGVPADYLGLEADNGPLLAALV